MPFIEGRIHPYDKIDTQGLAAAVTKNVIEALKDGFARQLGFVSPTTKPVAEAVIGRLAPGWVWVYFDTFKGFVAGEPPKGKDVVAHFNVVILNGALDNIYMQNVVNEVARASYVYIAEKHGTPDLGVTLLAGDVRMSVPGQPDVLLTPQGVHELLVSEISKELMGSRPTEPSASSRAEAPAEGAVSYSHLSPAGIVRLR